MSVFVIAEAGVNHQGRLDHAFALIAHAKAAGADACKFQMFTPEWLAPADYAKRALLKSLALTRSELIMCAAECAHQKIEFIVTPMDTECLDWLMALPKHARPRKIKVGSAQVKDLKFIQAVAAYKLPVIISNGMCSDFELAAALCEISGAVDYAVRPIVLSCVSKYPTPDADVHLSEIRRLRETFSYADIGFSSHCRSFWPTVAAVYAGATVVECHICLPDTTGPDIASSLLPEEFAAMVREIRVAETVVAGKKK